MREFLWRNFNEFPGGVGHATVGVTVYNSNFPHFPTRLPRRDPYGAYTRSLQYTHNSRQIQSHGNLEPGLM